MIPLNSSMLNHAIESKVGGSQEGTKQFTYHKLQAPAAVTIQKLSAQTSNVKSIKFFFKLSKN